MVPRNSRFVKLALACGIVALFAAFVGCNLTTSTSAPTTQSLATGASTPPAASGAQSLTIRSPIMMDAVFVLATIAFFAVSVLYVYGCGRL
jgi:hypothetical protein